jgi:hypothetical protein
VARHKESKTRKESQYGSSALKDRKEQSDILSDRQRIQNSVIYECTFRARYINTKKEAK